MPGKQKAKYIQSLGQKKHRDEERLFIAEGPKLVAELLAGVPDRVLELYAVQEWLDVNPQSRQVPLVEAVSGEELGRLSQLKTPNQVLAVVKQFEEKPGPEPGGRLTLVLDTIQDPGNLGTIIRIADWFGIGQIVCSPECADLYNPKVVQATMGSLLRVQVYYRDLGQWLPERGSVRLCAAALEGKDVSRMSPMREGLILIGNESKGIHPDLLAMANERLTIPRLGGAESLNAAVATGILLFQLTGGGRQ